MQATPIAVKVAVDTTVSTGLATQIGQVVGAAFGLVALVTAVLDGDHSQETVTAMILAAVTLVTLMAGRYAQATALLRDAPSLRQRVETTKLQASGGGGGGGGVSGVWAGSTGPVHSVQPTTATTPDTDDGEDGDDQLPPELENAPETLTPPPDEIDQPDPEVT